MKKILIVSLRAGAGHIKAAEALEKEIKRSHKSIQVKNIDFLDYSNILSKKFYGKWYLDLVKMVPQFYAWLYKNIDVSSTSFRLIFDRINAQDFKKQVIDFKPDLVICTHFVPANLVTWWREKYGFKYKVWLTVTDFEAHKLWADKKADFFTAATEEVKKQLIKFGIDKRKIKVTGIPIDAKFSQKIDKNKIRRKLGLKKKFTISIFSGGFGVGPVEKIFKSISKIPEDFQIIITAGKNKELHDKLKEVSKKTDKKALVFSFVSNIEEIMAVSDIIISKPGGLTTSESLAIRTPLLISHPIPGQEEANSKYLLKHKASLRADEPEKIIKIIKKIIKNKKILKDLKYNIKKVAKPKATKEIVKNIMRSI